MGFLSLQIGASVDEDAPATDADAVAFLTAAGISDPTITEAIVSLAIALKTAGVWTKLYALYPFVGGSASTHKWNLIDPQDTDAAFRLTFSGSWTHSATGAKPDGSTGYADTKCNIVTEGWTPTNGSAGFYSRTSAKTGGNEYDIGNADGSDQKASIVIARYNNDKGYFTHGTSDYVANGTSLDGQGFWASNRVSGNSEGYKNGSRIVNQASTCTLESRSLYLGACNRNGAATYFSAKEHALTFIGDTLSQTEMLDFYSAVQDFQTLLSRNV